MLIDFFYTLRAAKLPVSVKEYLTLLEALQAGVVGPKSDDAWALDDFYNLSRLTLVKDGSATTSLTGPLARTSKASNWWPTSRQGDPCRAGCARFWKTS